MEYKGYTFDARDNGGQLKPAQCTDLIDTLEDKKPERIIEFGPSGYLASTDIFKQYCEKYNKSYLTITKGTSSQKGNVVYFPVVENTEVHVAGGVYGKCNKYDGFEEWLTTQDKFDLIFIDDPVEYGLDRIKNYGYCRVQVLDFPLLDKLADNAVIYYHDSNLDYAKNTLSVLDSILTEKNFEFIRTQDVRDSILVNTNRQMTKYVITKK